MKREFFPHQQKAYDYLYENNGKGALFMQMRLGKTLVCIRYLKNFISEKNLPYLVVCPVEGIWAWKRELEMEGESYTTLVGSKRERLLRLNFTKAPKLIRWYLINYEGVRTIEKELKQINWSAIILDESRRIANPKAKTTKAIQSFASIHGQRRIILSGEPAPESPLEYFEQLKFVNDNFLGFNNYWGFRNVYFQQLAPHEWIPKFGLLERLKNGITNKSFILSRNQAGIPDKKIYETRTVQLPPSIKKIYAQIKRDFVADLPKQTLTTKWIPVQYTWLQQLSSGWLGTQLLWEGKVDSLVDLLKGELAKEQVVVWYHFNAALYFTYKKLKKMGFYVEAITGKDPKASRELSINKFRRGETDILLIQIKCGKTAIDLSNSSTAIYFSNSASLEDRKQSEDRILNPMKKEPLLYIDLIGEDTVEQDILELLKDKNADAQFYKSKLIMMLKDPK